jgi:hypothetical protein
VDLTLPIDITAVNNTRTEYGDMLKGLNMLAVAEILANCFPALGIQNSRVLGKVEHGAISSKYNGIFLGANKLGTVVPRTITVHPIVAEMADEPERYRTSFIAALAGNMWDKAHPFELWLLQHGINIASEELYNAIFTAKYDASAGKLALTDSFDGFSTIVAADITSGLISATAENLYANGAITRANAGDYLLEMWRTRPEVLRRKAVNMWLPTSVGDLYDDWYRDEHDNPPFVDQSGMEFLEGTQKKCRIVRHNALAAGSQQIFLTTRENMIYGTDKLEDMKSMKAFPSGNPYLFTATMKYVFGTQFVSIHKTEFAVNDRSASGSGSTSA